MLQGRFDGRIWQKDLVANAVDDGNECVREIRFGVQGQLITF